MNWVIVAGQSSRCSDGRFQVVEAFPDWPALTISTATMLKEAQRF
jgi:hypothetical protein